MEDLNHVEAAVKADATKAESAVRDEVAAQVSGFDARAAAAKRRAMAALNAESGWIDRHPGLAGVIVILALAAAAAMVVVVVLR